MVNASRWPPTSKTLASCCGFEQRIAEGRQEHLADELVHQLAAAAMGHKHVGVVLDRERTGEGEFGVEDMLGESKSEVRRSKSEGRVAKSEMARLRKSRGPE